MLVGDLLCLRFARDDDMDGEWEAPMISKCLILVECSFSESLPVTLCLQSYRYSNCNESMWESNAFPTPQDCKISGVKLDL